MSDSILEGVRLNRGTPMLRCVDGQVREVPYGFADEVIRALAAPVDKTPIRGDRIKFANGAVIRIEGHLPIGQILQWDGLRYKVLHYPDADKTDRAPFLKPPHLSADPLPGIVEIWDTARRAPPREDWRIRWPRFSISHARKLAESILLSEGVITGLIIREVQPAVWHIWRWGNRVRAPGYAVDVRYVNQRPGRRPQRTTKYRWESLKPGLAATYPGANMETLRHSVTSWLRARGLSWRVRMRYVDGRTAVAVTREAERATYT